MKTVNSNLPDSSICKLTLPNVPHVRTQPKKQSRLILVVRVNTPVYKAPPALKVRISNVVKKRVWIAARMRFSFPATFGPRSGDPGVGPLSRLGLDRGFSRQRSKIDCCGINECRIVSLYADAHINRRGNCLVLFPPTCNASAAATRHQLQKKG
jgi:hypothetical protein